MQFWWNKISIFYSIVFLFCKKIKLSYVLPCSPIKIVSSRKRDQKNNFDLYIISKNNRKKT
jgi:hypothetical protein